MGEKMVAASETSERSGANTTTACLGVTVSKKTGTFKSVTEQVTNVSTHFDIG